ncbi:MAG: hypothetical protein CM1200mP36_10940 [Gammaproteobacteria bacterium]|nr:MAG: hypothetical protein CM1200mP36_10940 [Gammaproteobacteria bacterium]
MRALQCCDEGRSRDGFFSLILAVADDMAAVGLWGIIPLRHS